jgi:hypothetical protein
MYWLQAVGSGRVQVGKYLGYKLDREAANDVDLEASSSRNTVDGPPLVGRECPHESFHGPQSRITCGQAPEGSDQCICLH